MRRKGSYSFGNFLRNLLSFARQMPLNSFQIIRTSGCFAKNTFSKFSTSKPTISPFEVTLIHSSPFQSTETAGMGSSGDKKNVSNRLSYEGTNCFRLFIVSKLMSKLGDFSIWTPILICPPFLYSNTPLLILYNLSHQKTCVFYNLQQL